MAAIKWIRTYFAMLATPLGVTDVLAGHLAWIALRLTTVVAIYLSVMAAFGTIPSALAIVALPAAVLTGLAFAAPIAAFAATQGTTRGSPPCTARPHPALPVLGHVLPRHPAPPLAAVVAWPHRSTTGWRCAGASPSASWRPGRDLAHTAYLVVLTAVGFGWPAELPTAARRMIATPEVTAPPIKRPRIIGPDDRLAAAADHPAGHVRRPTGPAASSSATSLVYRRRWIYLVSGFFEPFFYLLSIGIGPQPPRRAAPVDGQLVAYTAFVAPGLLASSAMNGAMFDSTFNIFFKLKIAKTYDAMLSTPLGVGDIALGELSWALLRGALYSGAFLLVMAVLGYVVTPWAVLCYPGAILISFAFAGAGMAGTTYMRSWQDFDMVSLAIIPLFLFSATFYPLSVYPGWLQGVVRCTPLYQGVALMRGFDLGDFSWSLLGHVAYLVAMGVAPQRTSRRLARLLLP